jgi:hypothetical protein
MKAFHKSHSGDSLHRQDEDDGNWFWSNHRGGGGAPLKTKSGEIISNLRNVLHSTTDSGHHSRHRDDDYARYDDHPPRNKPSYRDEDPRDRHAPLQRGDRRGQQEIMAPRSPSSKGYSDGNNSHSPRKFMSALSDMNSGISAHERDSKLQ